MNSQLVLALSFIAYSAGIIAIGLYSTRLRKRTKDDFVLANRELGPWASALSASASSESGWVMLGLVGQAFQFGVSAFWIVPGIAAGYIFNWWFVAERLRRHTLNSGAVTLPQFIASRFGRHSVWLRVIPVAVIAVAMMGYVAAQMNAAGKAFNAVFELSYEWGVLAGAFIILTYTVTGGFRAICWTDIVQATFMVVALIGMPLMMFGKVGSWEAATSRIAEIDPGLLSSASGAAGWAALGFVVGLLGIGLGYPGQPHVLARFMAARDTAAVHRGRVIAMIWMVLVYLGAVFFGIFARAFWGDLADAEQALPLACGEFLPPVLGGFVIAAMVSAMCSTADSQLIVVSSIFSRDIIPVFRKRGRELGAKIVQRIDRWVLLVLGLLSVLLAMTENRLIFQMVLYAWSALGAAFGPVVILGLFWKRATKAGAIAAMITGALVTVIWRETAFLKAALYELVPAFILAFAIMVLVSLFTKPDKDAG